MSALLIEHSTVNEWPWGACDAHPGAWVECSAEHWMYCLEVLPPIYFAGGFAVSEAVRDGATGAPVYLCLVHIGSRYFARELTLYEAAQEARLLRAALGR